MLIPSGVCGVYGNELTLMKCKHSSFVEAAFTTLLHADLLSWEANVLPHNSMFPEEPEWKRKENLYRTIIYFFDKGKVSHL